MIDLSHFRAKTIGKVDLDDETPPKEDRHFGCPDFMVVTRLTRGQE
jgi:hypothetical protein